MPVKITVTVLRATWRAFRMACLERGTSAGKEIEKLIAAQLAAWQHEKDSV